jgi:hypothetical protein
MRPKKKLAKRNRSAYHAFIYINILKTEKGMAFSEIAKQLNADNYRMRDGGKYTTEKISQIWVKGKSKYRMELLTIKNLNQDIYIIKLKRNRHPDSR